MARKYKYNVYKFKKVGDVYEKTEAGHLSLGYIERILGKVKVKNAKTEYELIEIKTRYGVDDGIYITERKNLTFDVVSNFIQHHSNGTRSKQHHPYEADLYDLELLEDIGMVVYTKKHFFSGDDFLADIYCPYKKEEVSEELIDELNKESLEIEKQAYSLREWWDVLRHPKPTEFRKIKS